MVGSVGDASGASGSLPRWLNPGALDAARAAVTGAVREGSVSADSLPRLEECASAIEAVGGVLEDAAAVLDGDARAAARLRYLLAWVDDEPVELDAGARDAAPRAAPASLIDRQALMLLVAGVTRAARDVREATAMLSVLSKALEPAAMITSLLELEQGSSAAPQMKLLLAAAPPGLSPRGGFPGGDLPGGGGPGGGLPGGGGPHGPGDGLPHWPGSPRPGRRRPRAPEGEPVWDSVPALEFPIQYLDPELCAWFAMMTIADVQRTATNYEIESIELMTYYPPIRQGYACPGSMIRITGRGFGNDGEVLFPSKGGIGAHGAVAWPDKWSDTEIFVHVPPWATSGELRLKTVERIVQVCRSNLIVYRLGSSRALFEGGVPAIFSLTVDGRPLPTCVPPDRDVVVAWVTSPGAGTSVGVTVSFPGRPAVTAAPPAGAGSLTYHTPNLWTTENVSVHVAADNGCGSPVSLDGQMVISVPTTLRVDLEVTQGVQRFPSNQVVTVAGKDTIVRAFVSADRSDFNFNQLQHVTGDLVVDGQRLMPLNNPPEVTAKSLVLIDRTQIGATLNFRIPAGWCRGTKSLLVTVWGRDECGVHYAESRRFWTWQDKAPLRVRWVRVRDGRPNSTTPGAILTDQEARARVLRAFDLLPTPATDIGPAWLAEWNTSQEWLDQSKDGGQSHLLHHLDEQHDCSVWEMLWDDCPTPDGARWIGLCPDPSAGGMANVPGNTAVAGTNRVTIAHELGHTLGRHHVLDSCGINVPNGPYDSLTADGGLLWDVAVEPDTLTIVARPTRDLMSYGCNRWTSADQWSWFASQF